MNSRNLSLLFCLSFAGLILAGCGRMVTPTLTVVVPTPTFILTPSEMPALIPTLSLTATSPPQPEETPTLTVPMPTFTLAATPSPEEVITVTPAATQLPDLTVGVSQWQETIPIPDPSTAPLHPPQGLQLIFHNGYVYLFGGKGTNNETLTNVYFSTIKPDGTLGGWIKTTSLPGKHIEHMEVKIGNYMYMITGASDHEEVYYAPFTTNGPIGEWKKTASLSPSRQTFAVASYANFIYAVGGNSGGIQDFVQYTSVKLDGSLNPWTHTTPLPMGIQQHTLIAYDGYLYLIGGVNKNDEWLTTNVFFSAINPDGTLAGWNTTTPLPLTMWGYGTFEYDGYIYLVGGDALAYYTPILENHALGDWLPSVSLPVMRQGLRVGAYNGYAYAIGGYDFSEPYDTVYYSRLGSHESVENPTDQHLDCTSGWTRLKIGDQAMVSRDSSLPNRVRSEPSTDEPVLVLLYVDSVIKLIDGPICANGLVFWKVESELIPGGVGWTAEGDGAEYYLELYTP